jgi:membrane protease YdiL (CAAX protease family)
MNKALRCVTFVETVLFAVIVSLFIWRWQAECRMSWIIFPVWLGTSFLAYRDTPKTLGWRADNLWPATRQGLPFFFSSVAVICIAGVVLGALRHRPHHLVDRHRLVGYFAFCVLQQVAMNSYVMNRLLAAIGNDWIAAALSGLIFAAVHWPNPVLIPITLLGGFAMCLLFARQRNVLPLVLGQAILGGLIWLAFPASWHHGMRVGPGYYSYAQRLVTW